MISFINTVDYYVVNKSILLTLRKQEYVYLLHMLDNIPDLYS